MPEESFFKRWFSGGSAPTTGSPPPEPRAVDLYGVSGATSGITGATGVTGVTGMTGVRSTGSSIGHARAALGLKHWKIRLRQSTSETIVECDGVVLQNVMMLGLVLDQSRRYPILHLALLPESIEVEGDLPEEALMREPSEWDEALKRALAEVST